MYTVGSLLFQKKYIKCLVWYHCNVLQFVGTPLKLEKNDYLKYLRSGYNACETKSTWVSSIGRSSELARLDQCLVNAKAFQIPKYAAPFMMDCR